MTAFAIGFLLGVLVGCLVCFVGVELTDND